MGTFQAIILIVFLYAGHLFVPCGSHIPADEKSIFCNGDLIRINGEVTTNVSFSKPEFYSTPH